MSANFAFYIHHHGSGHLMRALSIAKQLPKGTVTFLGSDLKAYAKLIPSDIACFHLPTDMPQPDDDDAKIQNIDFLHYAPLNVRGLAERASMLINTLRAIPQVVLVVDVSVEVTLLATLAGFPTVVIRQNGERNDLPHLQAYQCAQLLIAPCPAELMDKSAHSWVEEKTLFSGGFSRYSNMAIARESEIANQIAVLKGSGGSSLDVVTIQEMATLCPLHTFHVIGKIETTTLTELPGNIILHGQIGEPAVILSQCEIVIGNAGHNTVMEMADLDKKFICITEPRPFEEQVSKGRLLDTNGMCVVIDNSKIDNADWQALINKVKRLPANRWNGVINPDALHLIAASLRKVWKDNFE